jgi:putative hydrolase of the HAD superfamily
MSLKFKKTPPTILWDFDGTLAQGPGWSKTLLRVLDGNYPGHRIAREQIRAFLLEGFPWHNPERPHPELSSPDAWWSLVKPILTRAYQGVGFANTESEKMAELAHKLILDPAGYTLFEDTVAALQRLSDRGWRHIILSNNFPELPSIVDRLPIKKFIHECISSGVTGYEKPHNKAFSIALDCAGRPGKVWMVGDSLSADIAGAEAAGLPAILVHNSTDENTKYYARNLIEVVSIVENAS